MITLAIDTSSQESSLAIFDNDAILASVKHQSHKLQTGFFKVIEDTFYGLNLLPGKVERVIAGIGPGSFTGVRVGVSFAKTFCQMTGAELVPVRSYYLALDSFETDSFYIPAIPSTRTECYACLFHVNKKREIEIINEIDDGGPLRVLHWIKNIGDDSTIQIYGEASWMLEKIEFPRNRKIVIHKSSETMPDASRALRLIEFFPVLNVPENPLTAKPLYVRPSPAELQRIGGQRVDK